MSWLPFVAGTLGFGLCILCHVLLWRRRVPRHELATLAALLLIFPSLGVILAGLLPGARLPREEVAAAWLLCVALGAAYLASYPALQARSPSLEILLLLGRAPGHALPFREIAAGLDDSSLVEARFTDLVRGGLVHPEGRAIRLSAFGSVLAALFLALRRVLGLPPGKG